MGKLQNIWNEMRPRGGWRYPAFIISGAFVGLFIYTFFASRHLCELPYHGALLRHMDA